MFAILTFILLISISTTQNIINENFVQEFQTISQFDKPVTAIDISENLIVLGGCDGVLRIFKFEDGQYESIQNITDSQGHIHFVRVSSDLKYLISFSLDGSVYVYENIQQIYELYQNITLQQDMTSVLTGALTDDWMVFGKQGGNVYIFRKQNKNNTYELYQNISLPYSQIPYSISLTKNLLSVGTQNDAVYIYEFDEQSQTFTQKQTISIVCVENIANITSALGVYMSDNQKYLYVSCFSDQVHLLKFNNETSLFEYEDKTISVSDSTSISITNNMNNQWIVLTTLQNMQIHQNCEIDQNKYDYTQSILSDNSSCNRYFNHKFNSNFTYIIASACQQVRVYKINSTLMNEKRCINNNLLSTPYDPNAYQYAGIYFVAVAVFIFVIYQVVYKRYFRRQ